MVLREIKKKKNSLCITSEKHYILLNENEGLKSVNVKNQFTIGDLNNSILLILAKKKTECSDKWCFRRNALLYSL
jgi:hypothetical protein